MILNFTTRSDLGHNDAITSTDPKLGSIAHSPRNCTPAICRLQEASDMIPLSALMTAGQQVHRSDTRTGPMTAGGRSPLMRRRRLAAELHRLRVASQLTLEEVAGHLECSPAKISRIENGQVAVRIQDARELLDLYEVDEQRGEQLLQMVRQARGKG